MSHLPEMDGIEILPEEGVRPAGPDRPLAQQLMDLDRRGAFVRAYKARGGRDGNGQKLDPVLAFHLGLEEK